MMAASLALPIALFAIASTISYTSTLDIADREIERTLDVAHEHALKVFETIDRSLAELNEVVRGLPDDIIRAREPALHRRLKQLSDSLPQLKSAWIFDANGKSLVNSLASPPSDLSFADRDYFYAHVDQTSAPSSALADTAPALPGRALLRREPPPRFWGRQLRRCDPSLRLPGVFRELLRQDRLRSRQLLRDGAHRRHAAGAFPAARPRPPARPERAGRPEDCSPPEHGLITIDWPSDGIERRIGYRRVAEYPIYISAGWKPRRSARAGSPP